MRICRLILTTVLCLSSLYVYGEDYKYVKGQNIFEVTETKEYHVTCYRSSDGISSRNRNITDRQLRMDAIDLIGAYILYKESAISKRLGSAYFQIYVEGLNLRYEATLEGIRQSEKKHDGKSAICYSCDKQAYRISYASYNSNLDIESLLESHYQKDKCEESAALLYDFDGFTAARYAALEKDYLTGAVQLPAAIRQLQGTMDRFELSIVSPEENNLSSKYKPSTKIPEQKNPFLQFYREELLTAAPLKDKKEEYEKWKKSLDANGCVYESILEFCSRKCSQPVPLESEATLSSVIEAFPGAVSPFGIRQPIDDNSYVDAAKAYSESRFKESAELLLEIIDNEGISPKVLNLLGASYRFLGKSEKALPYLLLCLKLYPETPYLAGNIFLCLKDMGFNNTSAIRTFLTPYIVEDWSRTAIN